MNKVKEGYKITELGEIPNHWDVKNMESLFNFYGGLSLARDKQSDKGVYYLHYGDIHKKNKNYFSVSEDGDWLPRVEIESNTIKEGALLYTGDIVFADASEDYEGIGKSVVIFNENNEKFISGLHTIIAKDKGNEIDNLYKKYCFSTRNVRKQFRALANGATVYGISKSNIKEIKILVPSVKEQKQMALILSSIDEKIENTDNLIEKTKELKKGLMQRLLKKGIGHDRFKDSEIGRIPEEWEIRRLGDICDFKQGFQIPRSEQIIEEKEGYIRYLYITDFFSDKNTLYVKDNENFYYITNEDITIANTGNTCGKAFRKANGVLSNNMFKIFNKKDLLDNDYLWQYLNSLIYWEQLKKYFNTAGQPHVGHKNMSELKIALPNHISEQQKISNILLSVDEKINQYELNKEKLQELKKGLMQKLLTGKIRVY